MSNEAQQLDEAFEAMAAEEPVESVEPDVAEPTETTESTEATEATEPEPAKDTVPLAVFLDQKAEARASREQLAALQARIDQLENPVVEEEIISVDEDPVGHLTQQNKLTQEKIDELGKKMGEAELQNRATAAQKYIAGLESEFTTANPDYYDALTYVQNARAEQHMLVGMDKDHAVKMVNEELTWVTQNAIKNGKNPAEVAYNLSKSMGFNSGTKPAEEASQSLKALAKAQESSGTLANVPGQTGSDKLDVAAANNLSDEEFDKLSDEDFEALFK